MVKGVDSAIRYTWGQTLARGDLEQVFNICVLLFPTV